MAAIRDIIKSVDQSKEVAAETKETLKILMSMAESKADLFEKEIENDLIIGKTTDNLTIPITKVMQHHKEYRAKTSSGSKIIDEIGKSFSEIFSGDANIAKSICTIINTAFNAMMGAGKGQEGVSIDYKVVAEYPAIVRYDFRFWYRNIESQGIFKYMENAFAITAVKSVVDISKLSFHDFIALYGPILTQAFSSDKTKIKKFLTEAKEIYDMFQNSNTSDADKLIQAYIDNPNTDFKLTANSFKMTQSRVTDGHV